MRVRLKKSAMRQMVEYFEDLGRVPDEAEYYHLPKVPLRERQLKKMFRNWSCMLRDLNINHKDQMQKLAPKMESAADKMAKAAKAAVKKDEETV